MSIDKNAQFVGAVLCLLLTACSGAATATAQSVFTVPASIAALQVAGWQAHEAPGMPDTLTGLKQVGYIEVTAPDGQQLDMQFMEDAAKATAEMDAVIRKNASAKVTTVGNVMVVSHAMDSSPLPEADVDALRKLLR